MTAITPNQAATVLQKYYRGHNSRMHNPLPLLKGIQMVEAISKKQLTTPLGPQASSGITPVYFPVTLPQIVLKDCKEGQKACTAALSAAKRVKKTQTALRLCRQNRYQHLVVPRAVSSKGWCIEDRLPLNTDSLYQKQLYLDHPEKFTEAIVELTDFFFHATIGDLIVNKNGVETIRHDNLPLYLEQGKGKIGLIDLEHMTIRRKVPYKFSLPKLETLMKIFPLHSNEILKTVQKNWPEKFHRQGTEYLKSLEKYVHYFPNHPQFQNDCRL